MSTRQELLTGLLAGPPARFRGLLELFAGWPEGSERDAALHQARKKLFFWPIIACTMHGFDPAHPAWSLVRQLYLKDTTTPDLREHGHIAALHVLPHARHEDLREIAHLAPHLQRLALSGNRSLRSLHGLDDFIDLRELSVADCPSLREIVELPGSLEVLGLGGAGSLEELSALAALPELRVLSLAGHTKIENVEMLAGRQHLRHLSLTGLAIRDFDIGSSLPKLQVLSLSGCAQLQSVEGLRGHQHLRNLYLDRCVALRDLSPIETLSALRELTLQGMTQLTNVSELMKIPSLNGLDLVGCTGLQPQPAVMMMYKEELEAYRHRLREE